MKVCRNVVSVKSSSSVTSIDICGSTVSPDTANTNTNMNSSTPETECAGMNDDMPHLDFTDVSQDYENVEHKPMLKHVCI